MTVRPLDVVNDGSKDLVVIKFFGPDINPDVPRIPQEDGQEVRT